MINAKITGSIVSSNSEEAFSLNQKSNFGEKHGDKVQYSLVEALYLLEKKKLEITDNKKALSNEKVTKKFQSMDKNIQIKYPVFKDLREKGYIVKTALKFGADFRVYEKGKAINETHSKWVVFCDRENNKISWQEFSAKNRVAHSTKKKLLLAIVDEESDVTYYEVSWVKP